MVIEQIDTRINPIPYLDTEPAPTIRRRWPTVLHTEVPAKFGGFEDTARDLEERLAAATRARQLREVTAQSEVERQARQAEDEPKYLATLREIDNHARALVTEVASVREYFRPGPPRADAATLAEANALLPTLERRIASASVMDLAGELQLAIYLNDRAAMFALVTVLPARLAGVDRNPPVQQDQDALNDLITLSTRARETFQDKRALVHADRAKAVVERVRKLQSAVAKPLGLREPSRYHGDGAVSWASGQPITAR